MSLVLDNVSAAYDGHRALASVSLTIDTPELTGIIGPNGAGKSTLLKSIAGLTGRTGAISLDSRRLDDQPADLVARTVAWSAQSNHPAWPVTVHEVIRLGRLPHRNDPEVSSRDAQAIDGAIEKMALAALVDRRIDALSGGERSRALLARALCTEASVLLVDEPTADLDPYHELRTMEVLREEARRGVHVLAVLHDLSLAARFCDRVIVLHDGSVRAHGTPAEIFEQPLLRDVYRIHALIERHEDSVVVVPWRRLD
ncbi:MAG: ABC transporter ATP-binding protein [Gammaproteobacteria bacterium]